MTSTIANQNAAIARRRDRPIASPRARRAMRRAGIDPGTVRGSGPGGRIVEADVLRAGAARPADAPDKAISSPAAIFRAQADVTLLVSLVEQMRAHAPKASGGDFSLAGAVRQASDLALGESAPVGRRISIDTVGGTGVSPVLRAKHGQDARATPPLRGDSIAIVDLGAQGVDEAAIMPRGPEAGVLAIGRVVPAPGPPGRRTVRLTLWADLAALDAQAAAALLGRIVELVQSPLVLFLERLRS